jgi:hypothetical protein
MAKSAKVQRSKVGTLARPDFAWLSPHQVKSKARVDGKNLEGYKAAKVIKSKAEG